MLFSVPVLIILAYFGGVLSIASPCSGLMLPIFFANTFTKKSDFTKHALLFSVGAAIVAIPLGLTLSYIIFALNTKLSFIFPLLGVLFIVFGVTTVLGLADRLSIRFNAQFSSSNLSSILLGAVSAISLGTCTGPILGLIISASATNFSILVGSILMLFYVLGIVTPFILMGFSLDKFDSIKKVLIVGKIFKVKLFGKTFNIHSTNIISGVLFILLGTVFILANGNSNRVFDLLRLNYETMLTLQDKLIEFFIN